MITKTSDSLENYLFSFTTGCHLGYCKSENCGIRYPDSHLKFERTWFTNDSGVRTFMISGPEGVQESPNYLRILFSNEECILDLRLQNKELFGGMVKISLDDGLFIITDRDQRGVIDSTDSGLPNFASPLVDYFPIKKTEEMIESYRNKTAAVLRIFCPTLPDQIFSTIWDFAISDGVVCSKFICEVGRQLIYVYEDRAQDWRKNLSLAMSKIVEQFSTYFGTSSLLEKYSMRTADLKRLVQLARQMHLKNFT